MSFMSIVYNSVFLLVGKNLQMTVGGSSILQSKEGYQPQT